MHGDTSGGTGIEARGGAGAGGSAEPGPVVARGGSAEPGPVAAGGGSARSGVVGIPGGFAAAGSVGVLGGSALSTRSPAGLDERDSRGCSDAGAGRAIEPLKRTWVPDFRLNLAGLLAPLRRGRGDPTLRMDPSDGTCWRAATTAEGPAAIALRRRGDGTVTAAAWGPGAAVLLDGLPALLGAADDDSDFVAHHPLVADVRRRMPGLRLGATGRVWDVLLPAVLEQKVTGVEARRSFRELCWRFGEPAPGPAGERGLRVPPTPAAVRAIPDWEWHRAGVDFARRRALLAAATVAHRLENAVALGGARGRELLRRVPGIGVWTAAEVAQRAWGDPDAVSVGDFHIPSVVGWALLGRPLDDAGMLEVLAPYAPQRQRAVRYIEASGFRRPRFGPRFAAKDYRSI